MDIESIPAPMTRAEYDEEISDAGGMQDITMLVGDDPAAIESELQNEYEIYLEEYKRNFAEYDDEGNLDLGFEL